MLKTKRIICTLAIALIGAGMACGLSSYEEEERKPVTLVKYVELSHSYFKPAALTIDTGDTVTFRNLEAMSHPLVSEDAGVDTGQFPKGDRSFTFDSPGSYTVTNTAHETTLTIVVR